MLILASSATSLPSPVTISGLTSTRLQSFSRYSLYSACAICANSFDLLAFEPQAEGEHAACEGCRPAAGLNVHADDLLRRVRGDFLDVHAAGGRRDEGDVALVAIEHQAQVQLALDLRAFLDEHLANRQAFGAGLVRHQALAEHGLGRLAPPLPASRPA